MANPDVKCVYVLYGSQTGNAEMICQDLHTKLMEQGIPSRCETLNSMKKVPLQDKALAVVVVCSTTGNGDGKSDHFKAAATATTTIITIIITTIITTTTTTTTSSHHHPFYLLLHPLRLTAPSRYWYHSARERRWLLAVH